MYFLKRTCNNHMMQLIYKVDFCFLTIRGFFIFLLTSPKRICRKVSNTYLKCLIFVKSKEIRFIGQLLTFAKIETKLLSKSTEHKTRSLSSMHSNCIKLSYIKA